MLNVNIAHFHLNKHTIASSVSEHDQRGTCRTFSIPPDAASSARRLPVRHLLGTGPSRVSSGQYGPANDVTTGCYRSGGQQHHFPRGVAGSSGNRCARYQSWPKSISTHHQTPDAGSPGSSARHIQRAGLVFPNMAPMPFPSRCLFRRPLEVSCSKIRCQPLHHRSLWPVSVPPVPT